MQAGCKSRFHLQFRAAQFGLICKTNWTKSLLSCLIRFMVSNIQSAFFLNSLKCRNNINFSTSHNLIFLSPNMHAKSVRRNQKKWRSLQNRQAPSLTKDWSSSSAASPAPLLAKKMEQSRDITPVWFSYNWPGLCNRTLAAASRDLQGTSQLRSKDLI